MALLDEQIIEEWLNSSGYFTIRGMKQGIREIDLLAIRTRGQIRYGSTEAEYLHVEAQISFNPVGYAFGNTNAARRTEEQLIEGAREYYQRKFTHPSIVSKRNEVVPNVDWQYVFVHAVLREPEELGHLRELGVRIVSYRDVLNDLITNNNLHNTSSVASNIVNIIRYANG